MMLDQMWNRIEEMSGRTLQTVRGKPFKVVQVARGTEVTVVPASSGIPRRIKGKVFETAYHLRLKQGPLTAAVVRQSGVSDWNPVYVVAIINAVA